MSRLLLLAVILLAFGWSPASAQSLAAPNKLSNAGFEADAPSYWAADGAGATWSSEQFRTAERSLKLSGAGAASWNMAEAVRNWSPRFPGNADLEFGAFVRTEGVNMAPGSDAAKFQIEISLRDADGNDLLGGTNIVLDVPQAAASTDGWVELSSSSLGAITLSADATSATITVRKGADATGTVYVDDFFVRTGTEGVWTGDIFNANLDAPGGWYYWWDGFSAGGDWPTAQPFAMTASASEAHTGSNSLRIEQLDPTASEAVAISQRVPVTPGEPVLVSYWLKTEGNADAATIGTGDNNVGMTALWYSSLESGAAGYNELGGLDIRLNGEYNPNVIPMLPQQADNGWTQYAFVVYPREDAVGMELRLRYWQAFTGVTYWDDIAITNVGGDALGISTAGEEGVGPVGSTGQQWLRANAPNPFASSTQIRFELPQASDVTLEVYDLLGRRVALLVDGETLPAKEHTVEFLAEGLSAGNYLLVLRTPTHSEARSITIVR